MRSSFLSLTAPLCPFAPSKNASREPSGGAVPPALRSRAMHPRRAGRPGTLAAAHPDGRVCAPSSARRAPRSPDRPEGYDRCGNVARAQGRASAAAARELRRAGWCGPDPPIPGAPVNGPPLAHIPLHSPMRSPARPDDPVPSRSSTHRVRLHRAWGLEPRSFRTYQWSAKQDSNLRPLMFNQRSFLELLALPSKPLRICAGTCERDTDPRTGEGGIECRAADHERRIVNVMSTYVTYATMPFPPCGRFMSKLSLTVAVKTTAASERTSEAAETSTEVRANPEAVPCCQPRSRSTERANRGGWASPHKTRRAGPTRSSRRLCRLTGFERAVPRAGPPFLVRFGVRPPGVLRMDAHERGEE